MTGPTRPDGLREVGRIGRAHGVRGDVYVSLTTDATSRVATGARLWSSKGWLEIQRSKPHPPRYIVHFDGVDDRDAAEALTNEFLFAEPLSDVEPGLEDALWVHELIGARVVDQHGIDRGECVSVIENPAHDMLELADGWLVPVTFVESLENGIISVVAPDGLFE